MEGWRQDREEKKRELYFQQQLMASQVSSGSDDDHEHDNITGTSSHVAKDEMSFATTVTATSSIWDDGSAKNVLEAACRSIAKWPSAPSSRDPNNHYATRALSLPFLDLQQPILINIPPTPEFPQLLPTISSTKSLSSAGIPTNPAPLWSLFRGVVEQCWTLWEIMMIGEPVLVVGETPKAVGEVVWGCVELIKPVSWVFANY